MSVFLILSSHINRYLPSYLLSSRFPNRILPIPLTLSPDSKPDEVETTVKARPRRGGQQYHFKTNDYLQLDGFVPVDDVAR